MKNIKSNKIDPNADPKSHISANDVDKSYPGYPMYPSGQDIYNNSVEEADIDPENPSHNKVPNEESGSMNEKDFNDDRSGADLDIPGAELDDAEEAIGKEDEENNSYSIGGDNHNDLEENNG